MSFEKFKKYCEDNPTDNQEEKLKKLQKKMQEGIQFAKVEVNQYLEKKKKQADKMIEEFEK